jgi:hypothetical protein
MPQDLPSHVPLWIAALSRFRCAWMPSEFGFNEALKHLPMLGGAKQKVLNATGVTPNLPRPAPRKINEIACIRPGARSRICVH